MHVLKILKEKKLVKIIINIYKKNEELYSYLIIGFFTVLINISSKFLLLKTILDQTNGIELQYAEIISWIVAVVFAYITNKLIVFKTKKTNIIKEFFSFISGRIFTQILQMIIMFIFVTHLQLNTDILVLIFTIICQIMQIVLNYIISKLIVFKKNKA